MDGDRAPWVRALRLRSIASQAPERPAASGWAGLGFTASAATGPTPPSPRKPASAVADAVAGQRPATGAGLQSPAEQTHPLPVGRTAPAPDYPRTHDFVWEGCVMNYEETYRRSIDEPEAFWGEKPSASIGTNRRSRCSTTAIRRSGAGSSAAKPISATTPSTATCRARRPARTGRHLHRNQQHPRNHLSPAVSRSERLRRRAQAPRRRPW